MSYNDAFTFIPAVCDNHIIMQVDGAGWHRSKSLNIPANITLLNQPPYSPEVNPTEHI